MKTMLLLAVALAITGCASPTWVTVYDKPGATRAEYDREVYACNKDAAQVQDVIRARDLINQCMRAKGWTARLERG